MPYANINLEGRLVSDPEYRVGKNGRRFVTFRLAVNRTFGDEDTASFFGCTGGETIAARMEKAGLSKGSPVHLCGGLTLREYTDREGQRRLSADVNLLDWDFAGPRLRNPDAARQEAPQEATGAGTAPRETFVKNAEDLPF